MGRPAKVARGNMEFPLNKPLAFTPTDMFRKHPLLFRKFRSDEIQSLALKNRRVDMDYEKFEFSDANQVLKNITHFRRLKSLFFVSTDLTPQAWSLVSNFTELRTLSLSHVKLSTSEIAKFKRFKQLVYLKLVVPERITGVLEQLRDSNKLDNLCISNCPLSESDVRLIGTMTKLTTLDLRGTKLKDSAIPLLPTSLESLDVRGCEITAASIAGFTRLRNLRTLSIDLRGFSNEERNQLEKTLNNVQIKVGSEKGEMEETLDDK